MKLGNTCRFIIFWTIPGKTSSIELKWEGKITWGYFQILTFVVKHFHNFKEPCTFCKCIEPKFQKTIIMFHQFSYEIGCTKKHSDYTPRKPTPFFAWLLIMISCFHNNFFNFKLYFFLNNQPRMCKVNLSYRRCDPISFVIFN